MRSPLAAQQRHSWMTFTREIQPGEDRATIHMKNVAHSLFYLQRGSLCGKWICRGKEFRSEGRSGFVRFNPADGEEHTLTGAIVSHGMRFSVLIIPAWHLELMAEAEGAGRLPEVRSNAWPDDAVLRRCLDAIFMPSSSDDEDGCARDEAAWTLILRLAELLGAKVPGWCSDESKFSRRALDDLVSYIDAHLPRTPSVADMALLQGLSPGHFARKFRSSTGTSLHRFICQRRILASLELLKRQSQPLSRVALDLGFASQSHFTRSFSALTGMTPAKYRKQFRPTMG